MVASVSVIVPAYREAPNLEPLVRRVFAALDAAHLVGEMIIVDDNSQDGSTDIMRKLAAEFPVRIVVRPTQRGLSSAVLHGFRLAENDILVVMDADLQHPPEAIPALIEPIRNGSADLAVGSRYAAGGSIAGEWSWFRRLNSLGATLLARPLVRLRDPMSGFCALHRDTWLGAQHLNPVGYKIVLELAVKARCRRCVEIPITFAARHAGTSKLSFRAQLLYLRHLAALYRFRFQRLVIIAAVVLVALVIWLAWMLVTADA